LQLSLNALWSVLFFGRRAPFAALVEILLLWVAIVLTIVAFARISRMAALLLVPYLLWTTFATALNAAIWRLKRVAKKSSWCEATGMKQYPADFRDRLLRALDAGLAQAEAARTFGVPERTMRRWRQQRRQTGSVAPAPRPGRQRHIGPHSEAALREQVHAHPDATLVEHCARWAAVHGVTVSTATMSRALTRLGLPLKKIADRRRA
jgi:transposase